MSTCKCCVPALKGSNPSHVLDLILILLASTSPSWLGKPVDSQQCRRCWLGHHCPWEPVLMLVLGQHGSRDGGWNLVACGYSRAPKGALKKRAMQACMG